MYRCECACYEKHLLFYLSDLHAPTLSFPVKQSVSHVSLLEEWVNIQIYIIFSQLTDSLRPWWLWFSGHTGLSSFAYFCAHHQISHLIWRLSHFLVSLGNHCCLCRSVDWLCAICLHNVAQWSISRSIFESINHGQSGISLSFLFLKYGFFWVMAHYCMGEKGRSSRY